MLFLRTHVTIRRGDSVGDSALALVGALRGLPLQELALYGLGLGEAAGRALADALRGSSSLRALL